MLEEAGTCVTVAPAREPGGWVL